MSPEPSTAWCAVVLGQKCGTDEGMGGVDGWMDGCCGGKGEWGSEVVLMLQAWRVRRMVVPAAEEEKR